MVAAWYDQGKGTFENNTEALRWYRIAAERGDADSQWNLALMYEDGEGTPADTSEAQKWFELAAKNGVEEADQKLLKLASVEQANAPEKNGLVQTCPNIVDVLKSTDWKFSFEDDRWIVGEGKDTFSMDVEEDLCSFSMFAYLGELGDTDLIFSNEYNKENTDDGPGCIDDWCWAWQPKNQFCWDTDTERMIQVKVLQIKKSKVL